MDLDGAADVPPDDDFPLEVTADGFHAFNAVRLNSSFAHHLIDIRLELWNSSPPDPTFTEEALASETWVGTLRSSSGTVRAIEMMDASDQHTVLDLGQKSQVWQLRIILRQLDEDPDEADISDGDLFIDDDPGPYQGLEEAVLQFWPQS